MSISGIEFFIFFFIRVCVFSSFNSTTGYHSSVISWNTHIMDCFIKRKCEVVYRGEQNKFSIIMNILKKFNSAWNFFCEPSKLKPKDLWPTQITKDNQQQSGIHFNGKWGKLLFWISQIADEFHHHLILIFSI